MGFGRLHQMQDAKGVPFRSSQTGHFHVEVSRLLAKLSLRLRDAVPWPSVVRMNSPACAGSLAIARLAGSLQPGPLMRSEEESQIHKPLAQ